MWASLFEENVLELDNKVGDYSCKNLLRDMELAESDEDENNDDLGQYNVDLEEKVNLPSEWVDLKLPEMMEEDQTFPADLLQSRHEILMDSNLVEKDEHVLTQQIENLEQEGLTRKTKRTVKVNTDTSKKWGPVLVEGRTRRQAQGGKSMLERARELKKK